MYDVNSSLSYSFWVFLLDTATKGSCKRSRIMLEDTSGCWSGSKCWNQRILVVPSCSICLLARHLWVVVCLTSWTDTAFVHFSWYNHYHSKYVSNSWHHGPVLMGFHVVELTMPSLPWKLLVQADVIKCSWCEFSVNSGVKTWHRCCVWMMDIFLRSSDPIHIDECVMLYLLLWVGIDWSFTGWVR